MKTASVENLAARFISTPRTYPDYLADAYGLILPAAIAAERDQEKQRLQLNRLVYLGAIKKTAAEIWERLTGESQDGWTKIRLRKETPDA